MDTKGLNFPDISTFLDCVLNSSFKDLATKYRLADRCEPDYQLIPTIVRRCPNLESLCLDFGSQYEFQPEWDEVMPVIQSLSSLTQLSSLHLYIALENFTSLLRVLGTSCHKLSRLWIDSFCCANKVHVLLLIHGKLERDDHLQAKADEWSTDAVLQSLLVPPDCVTPYCSTLQHVNLGSDCTPASMAFLLRHLPLLETVDGARGNLSKAVQLFRDAPILEGTIQMEFDQLCRNAASRRPLNYPISCSIPRPSSGILYLIIHLEKLNLIYFLKIKTAGPLLLTKLEFVSLMEADVLRAVGSLCPFLKDVCFGQYHDRDHVNDDKFVSPVMPISTEELETILSNWPKVLSYLLPNILVFYLKFSIQ